MKNQKKYEIEQRQAIYQTVIICSTILSVIVSVGIFFGKDGMEVFGGILVTLFFIVMYIALKNSY